MLLIQISLYQIEAVRDIAFPPPVLSALIAEGKVDLYQSALFLGPNGAVRTG